MKFKVNELPPLRASDGQVVSPPRIRLALEGAEGGTSIEVNCKEDYEVTKEDGIAALKFFIEELEFRK